MGSKMINPGLRGAFYIICFVLIQSATAHVSLTYPRARTLPLDFLDNVRTKGPCGEPDKGPVTNLLQGSTFNITWFLAYAHKGGVKFEILEGENKDPVHTLTTDYAETDDRTAQKYQVTLPSGYTCENCSIRLIRQALEWGPTYLFWSCGRVNIQTNDAFTRTCSEKGTLANGKCTCERRYSGEDCQNEDHCEDNTDCNGGKGECVDTKGSNYPKKQCYCQPGWFGRQCEHESAVTTLKDFNAMQYAHKELRSGFDLYYRVIDENEGADEMEIVLQVKSDSYVALGWKPKDLTKKSQTEEPEGEPEGEPNGEPKGEPKGDNSKCTSHGMDCTDIVIGTARGNLSRIMDYYTRDRSTPREDAFYGGTNHLTAAIGEEKYNITTILFRKPIGASEWQDHSFEDDLMTVIYSYGQANPQAGLTENAGSNPDFYKKDELKFHGGNRGKTEINFLSQSTVTKRLSFKLVMDWNPDLAKEDSQATKDLDKKIITELESELVKEFSETPNRIIKVTRIEYSEGSVVVTVDVEATVVEGQEDTFDKQLEENMKDIANNGQLGGVEVDKDSITVTDQPEEESSGLETWAIVLIVIFVIAAVVLIAVVVYCCCCKSEESNSGKAQKKYTNQERGTENPNYENTSDDLPRGYTPCSKKDFDNLANFNVK